MSRKIKRKARRGVTIRELKALSRAIVFRRDGNRCVVCGKGKSDGVQLQWSHIVSQRIAQVRFLPENAVVHCAKHHFAWHAVPPLWVMWWLGKYPQRWLEIEDWMTRPALSKADWRLFLMSRPDE